MRAQEVQQQPCDDVIRSLDTVREMVVAISRLEKRLAEAETPSKGLEPECISPPPPPLTQFSHFPQPLL